MVASRIINNYILKKEAGLVYKFISPKAWQIQDRDIEDILKEDIKWDILCKIAYCQNVLEIVYSNISDFYIKFIPEHTLSLFKKKYYMSIFRNNLLLKEFTNIAKEFDKNALKFIPFKGIIFNNLVYPPGIVRATQDIDIMIQREGLLEINVVLANLGYKMVRGLDELGINDNFIEFVKYDRSKDFNFTLDIQWGNEASFRDANKNGLSDLWQRVRDVELNGFKVACLSPEDTLFNLFFHQRRFGMPFSLRSILDR